jgi:hypothetical protein
MESQLSDEDTRQRKHSITIRPGCKFMPRLNTGIKSPQIRSGKKNNLAQEKETKTIPTK